MIRHTKKHRFSAAFVSVIFLFSWLGSVIPAFADEADVDGVAMIVETDKHYDSLQEAVNVVTDGQTIKLLADTTENITSTGKSYTLDMGGYSIDGGGEAVGKIVYTISGGTVTLKNGTIKNGYIAGKYEEYIPDFMYIEVDSYGSGLYCEDANVTLEEMTITENQMVEGPPDLLNTSWEYLTYHNYGAGIYAVGGDLTIKKSTISNNSTNYYSGGIYIKNGDLKIEGSTISDNSANNYSGIYINNGDLTIVESTISDNSATYSKSQGGGLCIEGNVTATLDGITVSGNSATNGGGIYAASGTVITIVDSTIDKNTATSNGGGIYFDGSKLIVKNSGKLTDEGEEIFTQITDNNAALGGGIYVGGTAELNGIDFNGNYAKNGGAALYLHFVRTATISDCEFIGNKGNISTVGSSIVGADSSRGGFDNTLRFENCIISNNTECSDTLSFAGDDYWFCYANVTLDNCVISDNQTTRAGGIYIADYSNVTLNNTVIKNNTATGVSSQQFGQVSGGVVVYNSTDVTFNFAIDNDDEGNIINPGAIYGNEATNAKADANDLYIGAFATVNVIAASEMTDVDADADIELDEYVWFLPDGTFISDEMSGQYFGQANGYTDGLSLTARHAPYPPSAEYKGEIYESIELAIEEAKKGGEYPAEIKLLPGLDSFGEEITSVSIEPVDIDIPVILDLNELTLNAKSDTLFNVTDDGSLTITGDGVISGLIDIKNDSELTLNTKTDNSFSVKLEDENSVIVLGDDFAEGSTISIELDETRADALNGDNYADDDITYVLIKNGAKLELSQVSVALTNPRAKLIVDGDDIVIVNPTIKDDLFVSAGGNDVTGSGTISDPLKTVDKALELLENKNTDTARIHILDTITVTGDAVWDGGDKTIIIERSSNTDAPTNDDGLIDLKRANMINVASGASLTLENITVDGESGEDTSPYFRAGSMIKIESGGTLTLGEGSVLQNNNVGDGYLDEIGSPNRNVSDRSGGAVYDNGGTVYILDGSIIRNCAAVLGGGIYCYNGTIEMSGGLITNNSATNGFDLYAGSGGGICVNGNTALMTMTGGVFDGNIASFGGGVSVGTGGYSDDIRTSAYFGTHSFVMTAPDDPADDEPLAVADDTFDGGLFTHNTASSNGGALFVQSTYRADIHKGTFEYNECGDNHFGGGAIYVNGGKYYDNTDIRIRDGELWLTNVLIRDNYAEAYGGGIAGCNTSGSIVNMTNGSVIFNNYAKQGTGEYILSDISTAISATIVDKFEGYDKDSQTRDYFNQYMVDGTPYHWKAAADANGFKRGEYVSEEYLESLTGKAVYTDETPDPDTVASMSVIIRNNTSRNGSGGGIGTNGSVYIGGDLDNYVPSWSDEDADKDWDRIRKTKFDVIKNWKDLEADDNGYPKNLTQLNIWIITIIDNGDGSQTINKIHNPMMSNGTWKGQTSFEEITETIVMLEEAIYADGRHVWATVNVEYDDDYKDIIDDAIADIIATNYSGSEYSDDEFILPNNEYPSFTATSTQNGNNFVISNSELYGDLSVTKTVEGNFGDENKTFSFKVTLSDKTVNGTYGDMTFAGGVANITLKNGDTKTATGLPAGVTYTVEETDADSDGYITVSEGETGTIPAKKDENTSPAEAKFTNTKNGEEIFVQKVWVINDGTKSPDKVTVQLYKNDEPYDDPVELSAENSWKHKWTYIWNELQEDNAWEVREVGAPDGYSVSITNDGNIWTVTNTKLIDFSVKKIWDDNGNERNARPDSVTLTIKGTLVDDDGNAIKSDELQEIVVTKNVTLTDTDADEDDDNIWISDNITISPDVTYDEYNDGDDLPMYYTAADGTIYTFEYAVDEQTVPGTYKKSVVGYEVTNTFTDELGKLEVTKDWKNFDGFLEGITVTHPVITFTLTGNDETYTKELTNGNTKATFEDLPIYTYSFDNDGDLTRTAIEYTLTEVKINGYTSTITGDAWKFTLTESGKTPSTAIKAVTVTNSYTNTDVTVEKTWYDDGNEKGARPGSIDVTIIGTANNITVLEKNVTINAIEDKDIWSVTEKLPAYIAIDGKMYPIAYTAKEADVDGYEKAENGLTITNTFQDELGSLTVNKTWIDGDITATAVHPDITFTVSDANGKIDEHTMKNGELSYTFTNLPLYTYSFDDDGNLIRTAIEYTVTESISGMVQGYTADKAELKVKITTDTNYDKDKTYTNSVDFTNTIAKTDITITKVWNVEVKWAAEEKALRPESLEFTITGTAGSTKVYTTTVTLSDNGRWEKTLKDLPKYYYADGTATLIVYTVTEKNVPEYYTSTVDGYTVTNTYKQEETSVTVTKIWNDGNNANRPTEITVHITVNNGTVNVFDSDVTMKPGAADGNWTVTEDENGNWVWTLTGMPKINNNADAAYEYKVIATETVPDGYAAEGDGTDTITNTLVTSITVTKIWLNSDGTVLEDPEVESITVKLLQTVNGETTEYGSYELTAADGWTMTLSDLPAYDKEGNAITYTIDEIAVDGFETSIDQATYIITNTKVVDDDTGDDNTGDDDSTGDDDNTSDGDTDTDVENGRHDTDTDTDSDTDTTHTGTDSSQQDNPYTGDNAGGVLPVVFITIAAIIIFGKKRRMQ